MELRRDGTVDCPECHLPMFPISLEGHVVTLECANRHRDTAPLPGDARMRRIVRNWIARKGAQLHVQYERWEGDDSE